MQFRTSTESDIAAILDIIRQAQEFFRSQGIDQWQNGYPNHEVIMQDIKNKESYVLEEDGKILATSMVTFKNQDAYDEIKGGNWLSSGAYTTIHRIAVDNHYKGHGLATRIIEYIEELCLSNHIYSIKVDTHEQNIPMQKLLKKEGFVYCGIVALSDGDRVAFEKLLP